MSDITQIRLPDSTVYDIRDNSVLHSYNNFGFRNSLINDSNKSITSVRGIIAESIYLGEFKQINVGDAIITDHTSVTNGILRVLACEFHTRVINDIDTTTYILLVGFHAGASAIASTATTSGGSHAANETDVDFINIPGGIDDDSTYRILSDTRAYYESNAVSSGIPTSGSTYWREGFRLTERQVYGCNTIAPLNTNSVQNVYSSYLNTQLPYFRMYGVHPDLIGCGGTFTTNGTWLADVVTDKRYAAVDMSGRPNSFKANTSHENVFAQWLEVTYYSS